MEHMFSLVRREKSFLKTIPTLGIMINTYGVENFALNRYQFLLKYFSALYQVIFIQEVTKNLHYAYGQITYVTYYNFTI